MKSVSGTLTAAQIAATRNPFIHLLFTSYDGLTTYDLSMDSGTYGNRIILVDHYEEPYNDYAYVMLRNNDRALPADLTGYWVEIGYGDVTGVGNEYGQTSRLWVKHQQVISSAGKLVVILELEGMWAKLRETKLRMGSPPFYSITYTTDVVLTIISAVLAQIDPAMSLEALVQDDGIINTFMPQFTINDVNLFEDAGSVIYRLIKMTKSFLRPKQTLKFEVRYPQSTDAVDITIYSEGAGVQNFYEYVARRNLVIPNHIYCIANQGTDGLWTNIIIAEATNAASIAKYGDVPDIIMAPEITVAGDATNRAASALVRVDAEESDGSMVIPHDCRIELYDRIGIVDTR